MSHSKLVVLGMEIACVFPSRGRCKRELQVASDTVVPGFRTRSAKAEYAGVRQHTLRTVHRRGDLSRPVLVDGEPSPSTGARIHQDTSTRTYTVTAHGDLLLAA